MPCCHEPGSELALPNNGPEQQERRRAAGRPTAAHERIVFENAEHDFPQRIVYRRDGDRLHASIEGEEGYECTLDGDCVGGGDTPLCEDSACKLFGQAGSDYLDGGKVYKLNALPSGVVRGGKLSVIGNGVVLDPWHLVGEIASIRAQGVVQPIVVRPVGNVYEIIAGERRWRAAQLAGLHEIPAVIRDVDDQAAMAMALIENIQRDDLNPLEEAGALHRLLEEFGLTHQEIAQAVGKSRTTVTNLLRLLELEPEVKTWLDEGKMEMGHARAILGLTGKTQVDAAKEVVRSGLSVRETEKLVRRLQGQASKPPKKETPVDPDIRSLERDLSDKLGARVYLQSGNKGKGKLVISYNSLDELEGILAHIK